MRQIIWADIYNIITNDHFPMGQLTIPKPVLESGKVGHHGQSINLRPINYFGHGGHANFDPKNADMTYVGSFCPLNHQFLQ